MPNNDRTIIIPQHRAGLELSIVIPEGYHASYDGSENKISFIKQPEKSVQDQFTALFQEHQKLLSEVGPDYYGCKVRIMKLIRDLIPCGLHEGIKLAESMFARWQEDEEERKAKVFLDTVTGGIQPILNKYPENNS